MNWFVLTIVPAIKNEIWVLMICPMGKQKSKTHYIVGIVDPPSKRAKSFQDRNHGGNAVKPIYFGLDGCKAGWFVVGIDEMGEFQFTVLSKFEAITQFLSTQIVPVVTLLRHFLLDICNKESL